MNRQPFFYDVTLRDGNQALKKPWNTQEKEIIFKRLLKLGVQGIEVGFSGASDMDFEACAYLANLAPENVVISGLARAVKYDIDKVAQAIKNAPKPRIHTFIAMNPIGLEHVLKKPLSEVKKIAIEAVSYAKSVLPEYGEVQFTPEHFGDCRENLDEVIDAVKDVVKAGAKIINLPNTVERFRPMEFIKMVEKMRNALPEDVIIAVHCHNDLGMASATTVESFFAGADQLECSLNGLGERAGNTNMYEVAVALYNSGVDVPLNMEKIYGTSLRVSEMANVPIWEKAPIIGADALAHRSGIHQDGAVKTKHLEKGAYRAFNPSLIGRNEAEKLDPENGIRYRGYSISELQELLPKKSPEGEPLPEGLFYLMLLGELPTPQDVDFLSKEWYNRSHVPYHVIKVLEAMPTTAKPMTQFSTGIISMATDSIFQKAHRAGISKNDYWDTTYEDVMNLIARLPVIAAYIYRRSFKDGSFIEPDRDLDWAANFAHMMGYDDEEVYRLFRMYMNIHADHEGGNVSAHATHLVGSALSNPYYSYAAGMLGLAGP
ncbi:MAG: 2-isopropylmalate synthase LeuA2, partial [bacterium]